ncbi:MAG TPA: lipocalin-like domain-containing protein [Candidatus Omnitrophota bacterium]|nr:lipocalin-like domain-containing protein [Candidatus Omnitrophota bacterium]
MKPDPLPPPAPDLAAAILGIWRLTSREDYDAGGRRLIDPVLGAEPLGILCFAPKQFAAQFMNRARGLDSWSQTPAAPAAGINNTGAVDGYDAYFGTYDLDAAAGTIMVSLNGALSRGNIGMKATRDVRVAGNRLWIRLATSAADGTAITRTLTFERSG